MVPLSMIEQEFPAATPTPPNAQSEQIRAYLQYALQSWKKPTPRFVVLAGAVSRIPTYRIKNCEEFIRFGDRKDSVSLDELYGVASPQTSLSSLSPMIIGRLPARNVAELGAIITKIRRVEDGLSLASYSTHLTFLAADDTTDGDIFQYTATDAANRSSLKGYASKTLRYHYSSPADSIRPYIAQAMNSNTLFFNYFGHGSPSVWSHARIWRTENIDSLLRPANPFIYTAVACSQDFDNPYTPSLVEKLMTLPQGGAVATVASSGLSYLHVGQSILAELYDAIFATANASEQPTLGEALWRAKAHMMQANGECRSATRFSLLGDPALQIPVSKNSNTTAIVTLPATQCSLVFESTSRSGIVLCQSSPSQVNLRCVIRNSLGQTVWSSEETLRNGAGELSFSLAHVPNGVYFYEVRIDNVPVQHGKFSTIE